MSFSGESHKQHEKVRDKLSDKKVMRQINNAHRTFLAHLAALDNRKKKKRGAPCPLFDFDIPRIPGLINPLRFCWAVDLLLSHACCAKSCTCKPTEDR